MQLFGLSLAGLAYKYIVEPPQMVSALLLTLTYYSYYEEYKSE